MRHSAILVVGLACFSLGVLAAQTQTAVTVGDGATPLRALTGDGNVAISNAVLRNQPDVRVLRVHVEAGGTRAVHSHDDVKFHLFVPMTGPMTLDVEGAPPAIIPAWQPAYMKAGTRHGFRNTGAAPVDILEVFVR